MGRKKPAKSTRSRSARKTDMDELPEYARFYLADLKKRFEREQAALDSKVEEILIVMQQSLEIKKILIDPAFGMLPIEELPETSEPKVRTRSSRRRSRSCSFAVPKGPALKRKKAVSSENKDRITYQTPANRGIPQANFITPKVDFNAPLAIMRRPRQGELAVSMSGSPLLVSSITKEDSVNINIPLDDGSVVSILPQAGLQRRDFPSEFSHHTKQQLQTIYQNLNVILQQD